MGNPYLPKDIEELIPKRKPQVGSQTEPQVQSQPQVSGKKIDPLEVEQKLRWVDARTGEEINPPAFGGYTRAGTPRYSEGRMFTERGELNASDKADAWRNIQHFFNVLSSSKPMLIPRGQTLEQYMSVLAEYLSDPTGVGFARVGQELLNPIREVIDYEGWARKILTVRPVHRGEVVKYDRDVFVLAWVIGEDGQTPESAVGGEHFYPPEFEVTALPTLELRNIFQAQYDIIARTQDRARQAIEYQEDMACKRLLERAATTVNKVIGFSALDLSSIEQLRLQVERHRLIADKILINRAELSDIINLIPQVDPVTQRTLFMLGYVGQIYNMSIIVSAGVNTFEVVLPGEVYVVTLPEYLGGMPIRVELTSQPVNMFWTGRAAQGWFWYSLLSMIIINPAGVAKGIKI